MRQLQLFYSVISKCKFLLLEPKNGVSLASEWLDKNDVLFSNIL